MKKRGKWSIILGLAAGLIFQGCGGGSGTTSDTTKVRATLPPPESTVPRAPAAPAPTAGAGAKTLTTVPGGMGDVTIISCTLPDNPNGLRSELVGPEATIKIVNNSSKQLNYLIKVGFLSKDGATQFDMTPTGAMLAPSESREETVAALKPGVREQVAVAGLSCKVLDVTRY